MSLLDSMLAAAPRGNAPRIIHDNRNIQDIDWLRGMTDPGEMLECGYLPELRRRDHENAETHYNRILPIYHALPADVKAKLDAAGRRAAIRRAGLDTSTGRVIAAYAYKSAWTKVGTTFASEMTADEICDLGYGFHVDKIPQCFRWTDKHGNEVIKEYKDGFLLVRTDTGEALAAVGSRYEPLQQRTLLNTLQKVKGEFGAVFHSAAILDGGRRVFATLKLEGHQIKVNGQDVIDPYLAIVNTHGYGCWSGYTSATRDECKNTVNASLAQATKDGRVYKGRHSGDMEIKIDEMRAKFGTAIKEIDLLGEHAQQMARTQLRNPKQFYNNVLDEVLEVTAAQTMTGAQALAAAEAKDKEQREELAKYYESLIERRKTILDDMLDRHERPTNNVYGMTGTAWQGFNTVTEHANHNNIGRQVGSQSARDARRLDSILAGDANNMIQAARTQALAL